MGENFGKFFNERGTSWNPRVLGRLRDSGNSENFGDLGHSEGSGDLGDSEDSEGYGEWGDWGKSLYAGKFGNLLELRRIPGTYVFGRTGKFGNSGVGRLRN